MTVSTKRSMFEANRHTSSVLYQHKTNQVKIKHMLMQQIHKITQ